jgi:hypothetical protein
MARFVSIGRLERGASPSTAQVEAEPTGSGQGVRWRVRARAEEGGVELPDGLFRELFAPADDHARALYQRGFRQ